MALAIESGKAVTKDEKKKEGRTKGKEPELKGTGGKKEAKGKVPEKKEEKSAKEGRGKESKGKTEEGGKKRGESRTPREKGKSSKDK
jgi:hypothetical protein